ncbi:MAG: hypothetical protein WCB27_25600 [Thermoguttaceae bacterium]
MRRCLTRWIAAAAIGAALCFGGCAADGTPERGSHPFAKSAGAGGDDSAHGQAKAHSFPTAQEAGL